MTRIVLLFAFLPLPAFAHVGDHAHAGLWHLLLQADHVPMLGLGMGFAIYALVKFGVRR